jgi:hypothetical protein
LDELPPDPPGWDARDRSYADARRQFMAAHHEWQAAGGFRMNVEAPSSPAESGRWRQAKERSRQARERMHALGREASPPNPQALLSRLDAGDAAAVEEAVAWLELDPFAWNTGYLKSRIMSRLRRVPMSEDHAQRVRVVLLRLMKHGGRWEFRDACKLATHVDCPEFRARLQALAARPEPWIAVMAARMLAACDTKGRHGRAG